MILNSQKANQEIDISPICIEIVLERQPLLPISLCFTETVLAHGETTYRGKNNIAWLLAVGLFYKALFDTNPKNLTSHGNCSSSTLSPTFILLQHHGCCTVDLFFTIPTKLEKQNGCLFFFFRVRDNICTDFPPKKKKKECYLEQNNLTLLFLGSLYCCIKNKSISSIFYQ